MNKLGRLRKKQKRRLSVSQLRFIKANEPWEAVEVIYETHCSPEYSAAWHGPVAAIFASQKTNVRVRMPLTFIGVS